MTDSTLVSGFLPFGGFRVNPSALLAEASGRRFELLEVSFAAVDAFLDRLSTMRQPFDRLLMLGVRASGTAIDIERVARNHVGAEPDVRGYVRGPGQIEPGGPAFLTGTMFGSDVAESFRPSDDAGCYLCNYAYYRALRLLPGKRVGFVHVPPLECVPIDAQRLRIAELIARIERRTRSAVA